MSVTLPDTYDAWCGTCGKMRDFGITDGRCVSIAQHPVVVPVRLCSTCFEWKTFLFVTGECGACYCDRRWAEYVDGQGLAPSAHRETDAGAAEPSRDPASVPVRGQR